MINIKSFSLIVMIAFLFSCKAESSRKIRLSKLIYHLSRCNGTCPRIDLEIDSNKNLFVDREYFKTKNETDSTYSGQFKSVLTEDQYDKLIKILEDCDLKTLTFTESDVTDSPETTIIVYYNGQRKYLKSAEPPSAALDLTYFLSSIGDNKNLEKTNDIKAIEE